MIRSLRSLAASVGLTLALATPAATEAGDPPPPQAPAAVQALTEFRANTFLPSAQHSASLAVAPQAHFTVVWASRRQASGRSTVLRQQFDHRGVALGEETPLALWSKGHLTVPVFAYADDGSAWGAWQSADQDGDGAAIIARRFDATGQGQSEVLVNRTTAGDQMGPVLAVLGDGRAAFAWTDASPSGHAHVRVRLFTADGKALGDERPVDEGEGYRTTMPSLVRDTDDRVAVAYTRFDERSGVSLGVWLRILDAEGHWASDPQQVAKAGAVEPVLARTTQGYVLAWHAVEDAQADYDVFASRLDEAGRTVGEVVRVNGERLGLQNGAAVTEASDGRIFIAYNHQHGAQRDVYLRTFDTALNSLGAEERLTKRSTGDQKLAEAVGTQRLATTPEGALLSVWQGEVSDTEGNGVGVTLHHPAPRRAASDPVAGVTEGMQPYLPSGSVTTAGEQAALPHRPPIVGQRPAEVTDRRTLTTQNGVGFTGIFNTGLTPPDPHLAVGPEQLVLMANGEIAFFTKDGTRTFQQGLEGAGGFWGSVGASDFIFDPEVIYDPRTGRFFAMAAEAFAPGGRSYVLVAVSDDMDPNGEWFRYRFETTATSGDLFDSPNIGVTDDALVITGDGFGVGAVYAVYAYDKASLLNGDPPAIERQFLFPTVTQSAGYPRVTSGTGDTLYLVEHKEGFTNNTQVRVIAFSDLLGTPSTDFVDVTVPAYGAPEDPPQAGTTSRPETFDARFWSVDQGADGNLWATHHINPDRVVARWYELALNGWPTSGGQPQLVQSGDIDLGPDVRTYFSAINAGDDGSIAITYSRSSPSEFISMESAYRTPCAAAGTVTEVLRHQETVGGYTLGRWGDYAAVQFDPIDPAVYWAHHEFAQNNSWRTWAQSVDTTTSCTLVDINGDAAVNGRDARIFLRSFDLQRCLGDWNRDGEFTQADRASFFGLWSTCRD